MIKRKLKSCNAIVDSITLNILYIFYGFMKNYVKSKFRFEKVSKLKKFKSSDTLIILGAGESANRLKDFNLKLLDGFDVAGLSYSCVLPIVKDFYFYETPASYDKDALTEHVKKIFPEVVNSIENKNIICNIWKNSEDASAASLFNLDSFRVINVCHILSNNIIVIRRLYRYFHALRLDNFFLMQKRGSIAAIINFANLLKYKRVIFVGVDLNNSVYFFNKDETYKKYNFNNPFGYDDNKGSSTVHLTNDKSKGVPISSVIEAMAKEFNNIDFFTSSDSSLLASFLPVWSFEKKLRVSSKNRKKA